MKLKAIAKSLEVSSAKSHDIVGDLIFSDWSIPSVYLDELVNALEDVIRQKGSGSFWLEGSDLSVSTRYSTDEETVDIAFLNGTHTIANYQVNASDLEDDVSTIASTL